MTGRARPPGSLTSGGMWPRCICPTMTCCCGEGMLPTLKVSGPLEPERITAGSATEPCSTFPVRLNCCCKMVDLRGQTLRSLQAGRSRGASRYLIPQVSAVLVLHATTTNLKEANTDRVLSEETALKRPAKLSMKESFYIVSTVINSWHYAISSSEGHGEQ